MSSCFNGINEIFSVNVKIFVLIINLSLKITTNKQYTLPQFLNQFPNFLRTCLCSTSSRHIRSGLHIAISWQSKAPCGCRKSVTTNIQQTNGPQLGRAQRVNEAPTMARLTLRFTNAPPLIDLFVSPSSKAIVAGDTDFCLFELKCICLVYKDWLIAEW